MAADEPTYWTVSAVKIEEEEMLSMEQSSTKLSETGIEEEPLCYNDPLLNGEFSPKQEENINEEPDDILMKGKMMKEEDSGSQNKVEPRRSRRNISTEQRVQQQNQPGVKRYQRHQCDECVRSFSEMSLLLRHQIRHIKKKPYQCEECGKVYPRLGALTNHLYQHSGIKPHQCEQCGIRFVSVNKLKRHMKTHVELRAEVYPCNLCGIIFTKKQRLTHHMKIHYSHEKRSCQQCGSIFKSLHSLRHHRTCHFSETPHRCDRCGKTFNNIRLIRLHECSQSKCFRSEQTFSSSSPLHSPLCVDADMEQESFSESSETPMTPTPPGSSDGLKYLEIRLHRIPT